MEQVEKQIIPCLYGFCVTSVWSDGMGLQDVLNTHTHAMYGERISRYSTDHEAPHHSFGIKLWSAIKTVMPTIQQHPTTSNNNTNIISQTELFPCWNCLNCFYMTSSLGLENRFTYGFLTIWCWFVCVSTCAGASPQSNRINRECFEFFICIERNFFCHRCLLMFSLSFSEVFVPKCG